MAAKETGRHFEMIPHALDWGDGTRSRYVRMMNRAQAEAENVHLKKQHDKGRTDTLHQWVEKEDTDESS